ncbi:hypothetical protein ACFLQQ_04340 [Actinomycetota bacterium]
MGFSKWIMKKGAIGGAARLFIRAYKNERERNPDVPDIDIYKKIISWRTSITGQDWLKDEKIEDAESPREFVLLMVGSERAADVSMDFNLVRTIEEVINEVCDEENFD